jgi:protocatechuate 3,4-dioxygenase beta subunit
MLKPSIVDTTRVTNQRRVRGDGSLKEGVDMKRFAPHPSVVVPMVLLTTSLISRRTGLFGVERRVSRKGILALGGLGAAIVATSAWQRQLARAATTSEQSVGAALTGSSAVPAVACILTPEETEGPYYIAKEKVRSNIAEHKPGTPLTLRLTVVGATTCTPIKGAAVDIWHCDATGIYSGFQSASAGGPPGGGAGPTDHATFLRGIQPTNAKGVAEFQTVYPGWYRGRTTHIHVKVHIGGNVVHTGQLFFQDSLTAKVYQTGSYKARAAARDTFNATDSVYSGGGPQSTLTMRRIANGGYVGTITLGVRKA